MYWDTESLMNLSARVVVMRSEVDPHDFEDENNVLKLIILNLWDRLEAFDQSVRKTQQSVSTAYNEPGGLSL